MKELLPTLVVLFCLAGQEPDPRQAEYEKEVERISNQYNTKMARTGDKEAREGAYLYFTHRIRIGDSAAELARKLSPPWASSETNKFIEKGFFPQWVPWANRDLVVDWHSEPREGDSPMIVFALFSDARKTNMVDALLYNGAARVQPLVDGPYSRKVLAVKPGDTMDMVFRELGRIDCEYFQGKDGKWRVKVTYLTADGQFISYEADAGSGVILSVADETI
jgi:hypothetical protein